MSFTKFLPLRTTPADIEAMTAAARHAGRTRSAWIRDVLRWAATVEIAGDGERRPWADGGTGSPGDGKSRTQ